MLEEAAHEIVVINDADIRVGPNYLRKIVQPMSDERVGLVTCLYRGVPARRLLSKLEALGISGDFAGQVLLARLVEGIQFGLGATLVTRKKQVAEIGGLARWADYLADDYIWVIKLPRPVTGFIFRMRSLRPFFHSTLFRRCCSINCGGHAPCAHRVHGGIQGCC